MTQRGGREGKRRGREGGLYHKLEREKKIPGGPCNSIQLKHPSMAACSIETVYSKKQTNRAPT